MPVNHYIPSSFEEIFEDFATLSPILFIINIYSFTCLDTDFLGPQEVSIYDWVFLDLVISLDSFLAFLYGSG